MNEKNKILKPHLLLTFVISLALCSATAMASVSIPGDTSIGIWDGQTYTLTTDVYEPIIITQSNLTLDGDDFTVTGTSNTSGAGVEIFGSTSTSKENVNVVNLNITTFYYGINTKFCQNITIENNTITNCARGIQFGNKSNYNTIIGNSISQCNTDGVYLNESSYNVFSNNTISDNSRAANIIYYSRYNDFYQNNFINNAQTIAMDSSSTTGNYFNRPAPEGGNYWDVYNGVDNDNDGFGDTPYTTDSYPGYVPVTDYLPWMVESAWANNVPVADAGDDQAIIEIGTLVQLDGSGSYDLDGDPLAYEWTITKPAGSIAELSNKYAVNPTFVADIHGDYVIELVVSDIYSSSEPDSVTVSFDNVKPVAEAGGNKPVIVGDIVLLDASESYDANYDLLTYSWSFVSKPEGSNASLSDPTVVQTSFVADVAGEYIISLVVNDGFENSEPDDVSIMAVTSQELAATQALFYATEEINALDPDQLKNEQLIETLTNKINVMLSKIDDGVYSGALNQLAYDILQKMNGCADSGSPDKNDWITTCEAQEQVYPLIIEAIGYLEEILNP